MSLLSKTTVWVEQKIITQEQKEKILAFERQKGNKTFWNTAFIIAGSLIGLGICLLVAANWDDIPVSVKLVTDFALFGASVYATYKSIITKHNGLKELFTILSFALVGATIGLIAQVFHLQGDWYSFALAWALLGLPFVLFNGFSFFNIAWLILLFTSFHWFGDFLEHIVEDFNIIATLRIICVAYLAHTLLYELHERIKSKLIIFYSTSKFALWFAYLLVFMIGMVHGFERRYQAHAIEAYILVFGFLAFRMYMAIRKQNIVSFKRNAILAETYIFFIFMSKMENLWKSGLGFISAGALVLLFIWVLRKTTQHIKKMEVFK